MAKRSGRKGFQRGGRPGISNYNMVEGGPPNGIYDTDAIKNEFARRLQARMIHAGWNQSELAKQATKKLPPPHAGQIRHHEIGRDLVSHYVRGKMLPNPVYLDALAKALKVAVDDLMPRGVPSTSAALSQFDMRGMDDGRTWLRVNRAVSNETAYEIMDLLRKEDQTK